MNLLETLIALNNLDLEQSAADDIEAEQSADLEWHIYPTGSAASAAKVAAELLAQGIDAQIIIGTAAAGSPLNSLLFQGSKQSEDATEGALLRAIEQLHKQGMKQVIRKRFRAIEADKAIELIESQKS